MVRRREREELRDYNDKVTKTRNNWTGVQGRQAEFAATRLKRSNEKYHTAIREIKERAVKAEALETARSRDHQVSIQSAREKRANLSQQKLVKEEKRVHLHLREFSANQQLHYVRADSARSHRVDTLHQKNQDWEKSCEKQLSALKDKQLSDFGKDIERQQKQDKFIRQKARGLRKMSKDVGDRIQN